MKWWQNSVVYQVYPRSYRDSNGDGIGDLQGVISKLDYLKYLGIDVIWLSPVYESPNDDNGYDISDYYNIMSDFGTMADMDELIEEANKRGIKIVMDLVANHTSTKHQWFQEAITSKENKYHEYYIFREDNGKLPNDIQSIFLGSAWQKNEATDEYYLHMFAKSQADLNWDNSEVRKSIYDMIKWWLDKGIGGFRLDVIDMISKDIDNKVTANGPKLHEYIQEMTRETFSKYDVLTVGETWGATAEKACKYSNLDGSEFSMIFNFSHILLDQQEGKEKWDFKKLNLIELKQNLSRQQNILYQKGWNSLFWNNHDLPRIVSRWGNDTEYWAESAKMIATISHFMQGTPYIYQGEEIGMTNVKFDSLEDYRDIETLNMYNQRIGLGYDHDDIMKSIYKIGRDNARTPMQWNASENAGFTEGTPWIKLNPNYEKINVEKQIGDADSILEYYRKLIHFRRNSEMSNLLREGSYELILPDHETVFAYKRNFEKQEILVICNFEGNREKVDVDTKGYEILLSNYNDSNINDGIKLRAYEALVLVK